MSPSREEWEELGFVFNDIPGDDVLCNAILPEGWSMRTTEHSMQNEIMDENGMKRGSMFYKAAPYDRCAHMSLERRYKVCLGHVGDDYSTSEVYFGNEKEKLFIAGQVHIPKDISHEEMLTKYYEMDELKDVAKNFGDENYPGWESALAYWENGKDFSQTPLKK